MNYIKLPQDNIPLVLLGDVMQGLRKIPSESISCIVTSPPYWNLREYYIAGQIGREKTPEEYIDKMVEVSKELLRILKKDGAYFLNIGDTYIDKGLQMIPQRVGRIQSESGVFLDFQYQKSHLPNLALNLKNI